MITTLDAGRRVTVRLLKHSRTVEYPATVRYDDGTHLAVDTTWSGTPDKDLGFVRFENGDLLTEHYWRDRWYSVKEVRDSAGVLKGWYCDVTRPPQVDDHTVQSADLYLDLWMSADGGTVVRMDEDEFDASGLDLSEPITALNARQALDDLEQLARTGAFPSFLRPEAGTP